MFSPQRTAKLLASAMAVGAGAALWFFAPENRLDLLPLVKRSFPIADSVRGGASTAHILTVDSVSGSVRFTFTLRPGEPYPWAGIHLRLADSQQVAIDASAWSALELRASASPHQALRVQLLSDDQPSAGGPRDSIAQIYHALEFQADSTFQRFAWSAFSVPSWWRTQNSRPDQQRLELLDRLRALEFQSGYLPSGEPTPILVEITSLDLVGPDRLARAFAMALIAAGIVGLGISLRRTRPPVPESSPTGTSTPHLEPSPIVVLDDTRARQRDQLVEALRRTFSDPDLGLESFAASQGLSPRLVASLLKEATGLHFKGALNELRLTEAARLLRETKGNISEIGFAVGFQNPSHFGRAFRERFGVSPSEHRNPAKLDETG